MKVFGYSISLNVLILMGVLYLIMVVNALSGSCNREGFGNKVSKAAQQAAQKAAQKALAAQQLASTYNGPGPTRFIPPTVNAAQNAAAAAQEAANRAAQEAASRAGNRTR
jgi:hypothetical protein